MLFAGAGVMLVGADVVVAQVPVVGASVTGLPDYLLGGIAILQGIQLITTFAKSAGSGTSELKVDLKNVGERLDRKVDETKEAIQTEVGGLHKCMTDVLGQIQTANAAIVAGVNDDRMNVYSVSVACARQHDETPPPKPTLLSVPLVVPPAKS